jgi:molybdate transport system substrate-binding protein
MKALTLLMLSLLASAAQGQEITVAAAADLHFALDQIASRFQAESGIAVHAIYGSSGNFYQQIQNGAPFDVFLSANVDYPKKLQAAGLTVPGTYLEYARGKIVLAVPGNSTLDVKQGLRLLVNPAVKKVAIADPAHAPYGMAAVSALKAEHIYEPVSTKLVTAENISQAASFVLSGASDAGIIALSLVKASTPGARVRFEEIPANDYPPIVQACVVLQSSKQQKAAEKLEAFLRGKEAANIFRQYGFEMPEATGP